MRHVITVQTAARGVGAAGGADQMKREVLQRRPSHRVHVCAPGGVECASLRKIRRSLRKDLTMSFLYTTFAVVGCDNQQIILPLIPVC